MILHKKRSSNTGRLDLKCLKKSKHLRQNGPSASKAETNKSSFTDKTISVIHKKGRDTPLISNFLQVETTEKLAAPAQINH